jgi:outer membrane protein TolC
MTIPIPRTRLIGLRSLALVYIVFLADNGPAFGAAADDRGEELTLKDALRQALSGNPGLREIQARADAAAAMPPQAGALPDPQLSFGALNIPANNFNLRQDEMTMMAVGVSQQIPFPGKLGLQEQAAELEAEAASQSVEEARIRLARDVRVRWWKLFYLDRALAVIKDAQSAFQKLVDVALAQYRAGAGLQQDVLIAQLEISKLKDRVLELVGMRHGESARLNALLNRPANVPVRLPDRADVLEPKLQADTALFEKAGQTRPKLAQQRKAIDAARTRLELAHKDYWPDVNVGAGYAFRQDTPEGRYRSDFAEFRLSVNLPVYAGQKQSKAFDQRNSELLKEQFALEEELRKLQAEITQNLAAYQHARERLELFEKDIVPQARQTVDSLLAGYRTGQTDMNTLLRAETTAFDYEIQYWEALARSQQALAKLAAAIGEEATDEN